MLIFHYKVTKKKIRQLSTQKNAIIKREIYIFQQKSTGIFQHSTVEKNVQSANMWKNHLKSLFIYKKKVDNNPQLFFPVNHPLIINRSI